MRRAIGHLVLLVRHHTLASRCRRDVAERRMARVTVYRTGGPR